MIYTKLKIVLQDLTTSTVVKQDEILSKAIEEALEKINKKDNTQVISNLKQALNIYSLSHGFKLPKELVSLQIILDRPNKWNSAGITGSLTNL